jgi:hypothetical protein
MKQALTIILLLSIIAFSCDNKESSKTDFTTIFEESDGLKTATYQESIEYWQNLSDEFSNLNLLTYGETDAGHPLHLAVLSKKACSLYDLKERGQKRLLLINNAIHPGEPDGVDASMMLFRDLLIDSADTHKDLLDDMILVAIPFYNIGGALNRNSHSRTNQNGPEEYGFRGNAQNLDLNRDFIKCDSRNAKSFAKLIQHIDPELYIETHVSNGADYQYTMTVLPGHPDKLGEQLGGALNDLLNNVALKMKSINEETIPYVHTHKAVPDSGIVSFYDSPRYSTGYLSTLGIPGIITETHMLKAYDKRVWATYHFLWNCMEYLAKPESGKDLHEAKLAERKIIESEKQHHIDWEVDMTRSIDIPFNGYEYVNKPSEVSGAPRLFYDRTKPFTKDVKYYNHLAPTKTIIKPSAYILKRGFVNVEALLKINNVNMTELKGDTVLNVVQTKISIYETGKKPYEKHYLHHSVELEYDTIKVSFKKGDWMIKMGTSKDRFVMEVLEPEAPDSYFAWNFFDAVLQQKEWYSPYVFEDEAAKMLIDDVDLRMAFKAKKEAEPGFKNNPQYQLFWLFQQSSHYEKEYMILPIFKLPPV